MKSIRHLAMLGALFGLFLLPGCGGGSGSDSTVSGGTAVDPYIIGAVFQEVGFDGAILQESLPSDAQGRFTFPEPLTEDSVIEMKAGARGTHNGVAYEGALKRVVDAEGLLVASPLTTLLANGFTAEEVLSLLSSVGIEGLQEADLTADPMAGLGQVTVTGTEAVEFEALLPLKANMAVNAFMAALEKRGGQGYAVTPAEAQRNLALLDDVTAGVKETFSLTTILQAAQDVAAAEPGLPVDLTAVAATAVAATDFAVNQLATDPTGGHLATVQELRANGVISELLLANVRAGMNRAGMDERDTFSLSKTRSIVNNRLGGRETGTVQLALTDAVDHNFSEVVISIKEVRAVPAEGEEGMNGEESMDGNGEGEQGLPLIVAYDPPKRVDVLDLAFQQELLGEADLSAGTYDQLRLVLEKNTDPLLPANYIVLTDGDGTMIPLETPSGQTSGLKVVGTFEVPVGEVTSVVLDFDPARAIVEAGQTGKWLFKPTGIRVVQTEDLLLSYGAIIGSLAQEEVNEENALVETPITDATVYAVPEGSDTAVATGSVNSEDGSFRLFLPDGSYEIRATADGFEDFSTNPFVYDVIEGEDTDAEVLLMVPELESGTTDSL